MSEAIDIRLYQPGDESHILGLFAQAFGRELPEERWRWRYQRNPLGAGMAALAWYGDELVGHAGAHAVAVRTAGRDWRAALWGGVMTRPDFRGSGVAQALARALHLHLEQSKYHLEWGFTNALSHPVFVHRLGWPNVAEIPLFRLGLTNAVRWPSPPRDVVEWHDFDARADRLWQAVRDRHAICTARDRAFLQWRYVQNPSARYRILACLIQGGLAGYAVLKRFEEQMHVVDWLALPDTQAELQLLAAAAELACAESAAALSLWINVHGPLHAVLESLGFRNAEPVTYWIGRVMAPELAAADVLDYRRWYLTMGDSDVY